MFTAQPIRSYHCDPWYQQNTMISIIRLVTVVQLPKPWWSLDHHGEASITMVTKTSNVEIPQNKPRFDRMKRYFCFGVKLLACKFTPWWNLDHHGGNGFEKWKKHKTNIVLIEMKLCFGIMVNMFEDKPRKGIIR